MRARLVHEPSSGREVVTRALVDLCRLDLGPLGWRPWVELAARFVVPIRAARAVEDEMTRRVLDRFAQQPIRVASETQDITVHLPPADG